MINNALDVFQPQLFSNMTRKLSHVVDKCLKSYTQKKLFNFLLNSDRENVFNSDILV